MASVRERDKRYMMRYQIFFLHLSAPFVPAFDVIPFDMLNLLFILMLYGIA
jgi:hypothetical protein